MSSTYTPNLNLAKQATGDQNWGVVLNENFDKIDAGVAEKADDFLAGTALEFVGGVPQSVIDSEVEITSAVNYLKALGKCEQNGTPSSASPVDIVCNNGTLKVRHQSGLPMDYQPYEYITASSTQWLDTGIKLASTDIVEAEFQNSARTGYGALYGVFAQGDSSAFYANGTYYGYDVSNGKVDTGISVDTAWHTLRFDYANGVITLDGNDTTYTAFVFENTKNNYLFSRYYGGSYGYGFKGSCKRFKVFRNGVLICDLIPVMRLSDNAVGMYDLVQDEFRENIGSGVFTVSNPIDDLEVYIDGTDESILVNSVSSALTIENLLSVGSVKDEQDIFTGEITRRCAVVVYDGTQTIGQDYISSTGGLDVGAVVVYPLATPVTESVLAQSLSLEVGDVLTTSGSASDLELEVNMDAGKALNFVNPGYQTAEDVASAISGKQDTLVSGTNIKTINSNSILGSGDLLIDALPLQTGNSGKFLTTDGTDASWADVPSRNIGEVVVSTIPLTDAGLHLLDGSLLQGSGVYGDFVTYISGLVSDYPDLFDTEANWQTAVTTYGVCGKFVYDDVNGTVRLPKISGFIEGTLDATKLGDLVEAGLPQHVHTFAGSEVPLYASGSGRKADISGADGSKRIWITQTDNASNAIYGNSSTVQPQAIKVFYYIIIATSVKTDIQVNLDEVATDLNGKADTSLSNVNFTGTATGSSWAMPSSSYDDLTLGASGTTYIAPASGWFFVEKVAGASAKYLKMENTTAGVFANEGLSSSSDHWVKTIIPVKKNDIVTVTYNVTGNTKHFQFYYAQGEV